jgi:glycosyltransferase involved in cell wall biosynthesis/GR25 family glycosyltransferase involved in LPS biosynthesis
MKKIVIVTPHLSTGGLPQYLLKKIEVFKNQYNIYCIEWENITGGKFVVQRNKISDLLGDKLITLHQDKNIILDHINEIKPDIIHFEEIPETFINDYILSKIYSGDRKYIILSTTHSMYTRFDKYKYLADKFILVSKWSQKQFNNQIADIPSDIWEYPIVEKVYDKIYAKKELGWDSSYVNIIHVGLFTPGKNQSYIIALAKLLLDYKIKFHFIGNQAENFRDYWEPLMNDLPSNCVWHGEQSDIEKYYKAADLFYFPSKYELNPLSIKEALSFNIPIFLTRLETYEDTYDGIATFISGNPEEDKVVLLNYLGFSKKTKNTILHILTDIDSEREIKSMQSLSKLDGDLFNYNVVVSKRYLDLPPYDTCQYPEKISLEPGGKLTPGHYGCYLGHRKAFDIGKEFDSDYIIIFECDAVIDVSYDEFIKKVELAYNKTIEDDLLFFSFGFHNNTNIIEKKSDYWVVDRIYGAHAYLIPRKSYNIFSNMYLSAKWNVTDLLFCDNFSNNKIGIFETPITKQVAGYSILDKKFNDDRY